MKKRRGFSKLLVMTMAAILMLVLAACSSKKEEKKDEVDNANNAINEATAVVIDTKFGEVTVPEQPKRVVALGWGDAETALSLGVEPVGASDWLALGGNGVGPWLEGAYTNDPTMIGTMELDYEQIAALEPDLILDVKSSGDEERYKRLSEIAPTIGVPEGGDSYLTSMEDQVRMIAKALGKVEKGEELLKDVEAAFEKAAQENPEFADKTIVVGAYDANGFGAYVEGDARVNFATGLGFNTKAEIEALDEGNFYIKVADEQLELLDADLTVIMPIWVDPIEITKNELFQKIPSVEAGRSIILDANTANAFSMGTVPALLWTIENLTPQLKEALEHGE